MEKGSQELPSGKYILAANTTDRKLDFTLCWDHLFHIVNVLDEQRAVNVRDHSFNDSSDGYLWRSRLRTDEMSCFEGDETVVGLTQIEKSENLICPRQSISPWALG